MKQFLITYQFVEGDVRAWHAEIATFIQRLEESEALKGKISYQCYKNEKDSVYYHLATVIDESVVKTLNEQDFFKYYTEQNRLVSKGTLTVVPLAHIAGTTTSLQ